MALLLSSRLFICCSLQSCCESSELLTLSSHTVQTMQNIERDLNEAFRGTLSGNYEERHKTVMKVFAEDVKFWCLPEPKATTFVW